MSNNEFDNPESSGYFHNLNGQNENVSNHLTSPKSPKSTSSLTNLNTFNSILINELEVNLSISLSDDLKNLIKSNLNDYEQFTNRRLEEKDLIINQLKQNLVDLTEKRFRTSQSTQNQTATLNNDNIEFLLNEKENKINQLFSELNEKENEILKLKQIIKDQDNVILSHNNNIYELKNSNQTVLKAKQESFRVMNDDLVNKQKLIDDQNQVIENLKRKIETLEEQYDKSRIDLEKRLNEKENDLQVKIAHFEANLHEGKHYFEEILSEKEIVIKEKTNEINRLKLRLAQFEPNEIDSNELDQNQDELSTSSNQLNSIQKFDSENVKTIKSLYEHQIDLLKVKIEMLEKTCNNYQQGIKEMNKNFGLKQQSDEANSIQIFKDLMQDLQKTNVKLETEKIDLEVRVSKLQSSLDTIKIEKDNLNKKLQNTDQLNQKLTNERAELENFYRSQIEQKNFELSELNQQFFSLRTDYDWLREENTRLTQISNEHDQLKVANQELTQHYEQLYQQASDIVNGNQILNDQVQANANVISNLESQISELNLKVDHLTNCNSELNTQKINFEMKVQELEENLRQTSIDLSELPSLRETRQNYLECVDKLNELEAELSEKNELIDQLNQAKEFLAENNSKLLTNNIKIQLFIESLGLDPSEIESNQKVKEYDDLIEKLKQTELELINLKSLNQQLETNYLDIKSKLQAQIEKKDQEISELKQKMNELLLNQEDKVTKPDQVDSQVQCDEFLNLGLLDQLKQYEFNIVELQNENDNLLNEINDIKEAKSKTSDLNEKLKDYEDIKVKYTELTTKFNATEKLNLKLKAKLKQLLPKKDEKKQDESLSNNLPTTDNSQDSNVQTDLTGLEMSSIYTKLNDLEIKLNEAKSENLILIQNGSNSKSSQEIETKDLINLINFGSKIANEKLDHEILAELNLLKKDLDVMLLSNKLKYDKLKSEFDLLVAENNVNKSKLAETSLINQPRESLDQSLDLRDQIANLEVQLNQKLNEISQLKLELNSFREDIVMKDLKLTELNLDLQQKTIEISKLTEYREPVQSVSNNWDTNWDDVNTTENNNQELNLLREEIRVKNDQISILENEISIKTDQINNLESEISKTQENMGQMRSNIDCLTNELNEKDNKIKEFESLNESLNNKMHDYDSILASSQKHADESQNWQKKYESMRLKALAFKDKLKKVESNDQVANVSPATSTKSSYDSNSLAEHLFHNLQDEYNEFKKKHSEEINDLHKSYLDQIKGYENNYTSLQEENDSLQNDLANLKQKLADLDLLKEKLANTEKQNLKLKAKLKQLLSKQQEVKQNDSALNDAHKENQLLLTSNLTVLDEQQSAHSPGFFQSNSTQTESNQEKEDDNLKNEILIKNLTSDYETKIELINEKNSNLARIIDELNSKIDSISNENNDKEIQIGLKTSENDKIKLSLNDMSEKLKTTQDLNLKLKAKLKQVLNKQNQEAKQSEKTGNEVHKESQLLITTSFLEEQRSGTTTPLSICHHSPNQTESSSTQTEQTENYETLINTLTSEYESKLEALNEKNNELVKQIDDLNFKISSEKVESKVFDDENLKNELKDLKEKLKTTQDQNLKLKAKLKQLITNNKTKNPSESTIHTSNDFASQTSTHGEDLTAQIEKLKTEYELAINELKAENLSLRTEFEVKDEKLNELLNEIDNLKSSLNQMQHENEIKSSDFTSQTSAYGEDLTAQIEKLKTEYELAVSELKAENLSLKREFEIKNELLNEIDNLKNSLNQIQNENEIKLNNLSDELSKKDNELVLVHKQFDDLRKDESVLNEFLNQIEVLKSELESKNSRINELVNEINSLNSLINQLRGDNETSIKHLQDELNRKEYELESVHKKLIEFENLTDLKQKMNDSLMNQSNELKQMIEQQRFRYEQQLNNLTLALNQKDTNLNELNNELIYLKTNSLTSNSLNNSNQVENLDENLKVVSTIPTTSPISPTSSASCLSSSNTNLETQLKYCHEKCEKVVAKLTQLKKQNESLNSKIKSIKSMIYA